MLGRQLAMPFIAARKFEQPLQRRSRRKFTPIGQSGTYRLPHTIQEQLEKSLKDFRNADAAYALAVFLGRFWGSPNRIDLPFPIDRRALSSHPDLELSEARIRGAIKTLEQAGFLDRSAIGGKGSKFQLKGSELHRKPIMFQFGSEFRELFAKANTRTQIGNQARKRSPARIPALLNSPKNKVQNPTVLLMGDLRKKASEKPAAPFARNSQLEAAIARLEHAFREKTG